MRKVSLLIAATVLALMLAGCASLELHHTPLEPMPEKKGSVALEVRNVREADKGAEKDFLVGRLRNLYGMPIGLEADNSVVEAMQVLFSDALVHSGYQVVDDAPTRVVVDIDVFWMDGYMGYQIDAKLTVKAEAGGGVAFKKVIDQKKGFAYMVSKDMPRAYDAMMDLLSEQAVMIFMSSEFAAAVK